MDFLGSDERLNHPSFLEAREPALESPFQRRFLEFPEILALLDVIASSVSDMGQIDEERIGLPGLYGHDDILWPQIKRISP